MPQGDPRTTGYAKGTPDTYLASREATRTGPGSAPIDVQEITHGHVGPISGRKAVTTAGTRVPLAASSTKARKVMLQYGEGSSGTICVGGSTVVAAVATRNGFQLGGLPDWVELEIGDLADVYIDSTISGDYVIFNYWTL